MKLTLREAKIEWPPVNMLLQTNAKIKKDQTQKKTHTKVKTDQAKQVDI